MVDPTINDARTFADGGTTVLAGRYRIVRQLGQGGMGSVWLVEDIQLDNKPFAIKMLPSILVSNRRAYNQLKAEVLVSMKLTHQNIVTLRAFEENNGNPFLVMDYIEGQSLDEYLLEKGKLSEEETVKMLKPIADALDYAHGEGVVHRDVKPANVMVRKDGHPFILDFGIAREIQETLTRVTGKISSGTLLYMSPEQLNGSAPKAPQDVYSFSAMAYECLNGEPPFVRGPIDHQIINRPPAPLPREIGIAACVMKGLAKKAKERPATCGEVITACRKRGGGGSRGYCWLLLLAIFVLGCNDFVKTSVRGEPEPKPREVGSRGNPLPSPKLVVDQVFIKLTNDLAVAIDERRKASEAAEAFRASPIGFDARLKIVDETWKNRTQVKEVTGRQNAADDLAAIRKETDVLNANVKWMSDHIGARDAAIKRESVLAEFCAAKKNANSDLFARAKRGNDWKRVQADLSSSKNVVDSGLFAKAEMAFDAMEKRTNGILDDERLKRNDELRKKKDTAERRRLDEMVKKQAASMTAFMKRLDKEGFV